MDLARDADQPAGMADRSRPAQGDRPDPAEARRPAKEAPAAVRSAATCSADSAAEPAEGGLMGDDELALIFTCCHPALDREVRMALTLRAAGGLSTAEIAAAFLVPVPTMAQRLVRSTPRGTTPLLALTWCAATYATPRSGWPATWRRCCRASQSRPRCSRCCCSPTPAGPPAPAQPGNWCCSRSRTAG